ncbi:MAG TPA: helix-turn-helix domain-containing protein [Solirubrobacteraceae bacterium]|nr:helix-turn-helix domain-containing protein [Solirubrobacteraceae bacterium]
MAKPRETSEPAPRDAAEPRDDAAPRDGAPSRGGATPLPSLSEPRRERADAARNRERVLAAARRLFAERGVHAVTMSEVAREAGVAKGTVFHRFGDRAGLALALLDEEERALQERILHGPPPLGPGAPPAERLRAFLAALAAFTIDNRALLLEVDGSAPGARYRTGAYRAWLHHVVVLLDELGVAGDRALHAHVLLAPLAADLVAYLHDDEGVTAEALSAALRAPRAHVGAELGIELL